MVGNGNGIQYLGAVLIKSELSIDELKDFYSKNKDLIVEEQIGQQIEFIDHDELSFEHNFDENANYYIIYSWGNGNELLKAIDMRGHWCIEEVTNIGIYSCLHNNFSMLYDFRC